MKRREKNKCFMLGNTKQDIKYTQNNKIRFIFNCEIVRILAGSHLCWILPSGCHTVYRLLHMGVYDS